MTAAIVFLAAVVTVLWSLPWLLDRLDPQARADRAYERRRRQYRFEEELREQRRINAVRRDPSPAPRKGR